MSRFFNRSDAGRQLAPALRKYANEPGVVLAVPRGGVPVAYEVAKELRLPLEVVLVKKIGHPFNPEYAIGAVGLQGEAYVVPHEEVNEQYIENEVEIVRSRLAEMKQKFFGDQEPLSLKGKTVILVDDGIATGNTMLATVHILRHEQPARIVIAVPVIAPEASQKLSPEVDELIALLVPETFASVGAFYSDFNQLTDEDVLRSLKQLRKQRNAM